MIQELAEGTAYLGGVAAPSLLHAGVDLLRRDQDVVICLWPDDPRVAALPPAPDYVGEAIDFTDHRPADPVALPDGHTLCAIDAEIVPRLRGFDYYVAMFEGQRLLKIAPDGRLLQEIETPVMCPTMPCFGGDDLKTLYITSARHNRPAHELQRFPQSGCIFSTRIEVPGLPVNLFRE